MTTMKTNGGAMPQRGGNEGKTIPEAKSQFVQNGGKKVWRGRSLKSGELQGEELW